MTVDQIIDDIIRREGRDFTDRAADRGGPTKYGITKATLATWRGRPVTTREVQRLTEDEAREIYRKAYVADPGFEHVADDALRALLVDTAVLHGPSRAIRWLQQALDVTVDGILGPKTRAAVAASDARQLYARVVAARGKALVDLALSDRETRHYIATHQHVQLVNLRGWLNRVWEFLA